MNVLNLENTAILISQCKTSYGNKMSLSKSCSKNGTCSFLGCSVPMKFVFSEFGIIWKMGNSLGMRVSLS